jgi:hypothetical protein
MSSAPPAAPPAAPVTAPSSSINQLLEELKTSKLAEIKASKVSSQATLTSRLNIEQTTSLKRLKFILIISFILIFVLIIVTAVYSAKLEYSDVVEFIDANGPAAGIQMSGLEVALCLRYPAITSWFYAGNSAFPEAVYVLLRDPTYNTVFEQNVSDNLGCIYSTATLQTGDTSAANLICGCDNFKNIENCEEACGADGTVSTATSLLNGFNTGMSLAGAGAGLAPPFGLIGGFIAGFCMGFFPSQYPPGGPPDPCIS